MNEGQNQRGNVQLVRNDKMPCVNNGDGEHEEREPATGNSLGIGCGREARCETGGRRGNDRRGMDVSPCSGSWSDQNRLHAPHRSLVVSGPLGTMAPAVPRSLERISSATKCASTPSR